MILTQEFNAVSREVPLYSVLKIVNKPLPIRKIELFLWGSSCNILKDTDGIYYIDNHKNAEIYPIKVGMFIVVKDLLQGDDVQIFYSESEFNQYFKGSFNTKNYDNVEKELEFAKKRR